LRHTWTSPGLGDDHHQSPQLSQPASIAPSATTSASLPAHLRHPADGIARWITGRPPSTLTLQQIC